MKTKHFSICLLVVSSLCGPFALAQDVQADPQPESYDQAPPPQQPPPSQYQNQPTPDLMPHQPVEAYPEGQRPPPPPPRRWGRRFEMVPQDYEDEARLRLNLVAYLTSSGSANSTNGAVVSNSYVGPTAISMDMGSAAGFAAEVFMAQPFGWGFDAGVSYDLVRNINDFDYILNSIFYTSPNPTLQLTTVYGNGIFRWWNVYVPLGLNYTITSFSPGSNNGSIGNATFTGNVGFQLGVGFLIGRHFALELADRVTHLQASSGIGNTSITWGDVYFSTLQLSLKFNFL